MTETVTDDNLSNVRAGDGWRLESRRALWVAQAAFSAFITKADREVAAARAHWRLAHDKAFRLTQRAIEESLPAHVIRVASGNW